LQRGRFLQNLGRGNRRSHNNLSTTDDNAGLTGLQTLHVENFFFLPCLVKTSCNKSKNKVGLLYLAHLSGINLIINFYIYSKNMYQLQREEELSIAFKGNR
jgi:hypothetical protein